MEPNRAGVVHVPPAHAGPRTRDRGAGYRTLGVHNGPTRPIEGRAGIIEYMTPAMASIAGGLVRAKSTLVTGAALTLCRRASCPDDRACAPESGRAWVCTAAKPRSRGLRPVASAIAATVRRRHIRPAEGNSARHHTSPRGPPG